MILEVLLSLFVYVIQHTSLLGYLLWWDICKEKIMCVRSTVFVQSLHLFCYSVTMDLKFSTSRSGGKT